MHAISKTFHAHGITVEPHLSSGPQLSGCSDYPTIKLMRVFAVH